MTVVSLLGSTLLRAPAAALDIAAKALRVLADVNDHLATALVSAPAEPIPTPQPVRDNTAPPTARVDIGVAAATRPSAAASPLAPQTATTTGSDAPVADAPAARTPDLDTTGVAALAAQTAPRVIAALDGLSAEDLAELYEYESGHRRRATVLRAVEAAAAPPVEARADDDILLDDVREPDVLVYSTSTPTS